MIGEGKYCDRGSIVLNQRNNDAGAEAAIFGARCVVAEHAHLAWGNGARQRALCKEAALVAPMKAMK